MRCYGGRMRYAKAYLQLARTAKPAPAKKTASGRLGSKRISLKQAQCLRTPRTSSRCGTRSIRAETRITADPYRHHPASDLCGGGRCSCSLDASPAEDGRTCVCVGVHGFQPCFPQMLFQVKPIKSGARGETPHSFSCITTFLLPQP